MTMEKTTMTNLHDTLSQLRQMKLGGLITALQEQLDNPTYRELSFEERIAWIVDREFLARKNKKIASRLRQAALKHPQARVETLDFEARRGLQKSDVLDLAQGIWIAKKEQLLISRSQPASEKHFSPAPSQSAPWLSATPRAMRKLATSWANSLLSRDNVAFRRRLRLSPKSISSSLTNGSSLRSTLSKRVTT